MSAGTALRSETTAWMFGAVTVVGLSAIAYFFRGWIGIGIIGLLGLVISTNVALRSGHAMADGELGSGDVALYAKQIAEAEKAQVSPEQKMAAAAVRAERSKVLYVVNTIFIAMAALGFGRFFLYQL